MPLQWRILFYFAPGITSSGVQGIWNAASKVFTGGVRLNAASAILLVAFAGNATSKTYQWRQIGGVRVERHQPHIWSATNDPFLLVVLSKRHY